MIGQVQIGHHMQQSAAMIVFTLRIQRIHKIGLAGRLSLQFFDKSQRQAKLVGQNGRNNGLKEVQAVGLQIAQYEPTDAFPLVGQDQLVQGHSLCRVEIFFGKRRCPFERGRLSGVLIVVYQVLVIFFVKVNIVQVVVVPQSEFRVDRRLFLIQRNNEASINLN